MEGFRFGLLGYPLSHTLSPLLHRIFFEIIGKPGRYEKFEVPPEGLANWLDQCRQSALLHGFNVTIPYKVRIIPCLQGLSAQAEMIGAVNMVICKEDGLYGENSDADGFIDSLESEERNAIAGAHALVIGTGGASRAIAYALLKNGIASLTFQARNAQRAQETIARAERMNRALQNRAAAISLVTRLEPAVMERFDWIINTTPAGMNPRIEDTPLPQVLLKNLSSKARVYDLIYNPLETKLLQDAREIGLNTKGGIGMLVYQGIRSFELWTGQTLPRESVVLAWNDIIRLVEKTLASC